MEQNRLIDKALLAELLTTYMLVFIGGMAVMEADRGNLSVWGVAIAHTLVLVFMVYFSYDISGAHINPAVTLGFVVTGHMAVFRGAYYIIYQILGSTLAGLSLLVLAGDDLLQAAASKSVLGFPQISSGYPAIYAILLEALLTFILVIVIWATAVDMKGPQSFYGLAIGGTVGMNIIAAGSLTGAAMNPARVIGPALVSFSLADIWIYIIGPILGGVIAAVTYKIIFHHKTNKNE